MGILSRLFGAATASPVEALGNVFDKIFTSDEERRQADAVLLALRQKPHILQAEINKVEAAHRSVFVAGWRPFIGWVCGLGLMWAFIGHPIAVWLVNLRGWDGPLPQSSTEGLLELVLALLGLGSLRTAEKISGRSR